MRFKGNPALITFHEEERRGFRNVSLDSVTAVSQRQTPDPAAEHPHPDESAWETALEAAPWIVGSPHTPRPLPHPDRAPLASALVADGLHTRTDGFTPLAVVLGTLRRCERVAAGRPHRRPAYHRRHRSPACLGGPAVVPRWRLGLPTGPAAATAGPPGPPHADCANDHSRPPRPITD